MRALHPKRRWRVALSARNARQLDVVQRFEAWAREEPGGRTEASRVEARELNRILRDWFTNVTLAMDARSVMIVGDHRASSNRCESCRSSEARFDRREWMRWSPVARRTHQIYSEWEDSEILGALQRWADAHGRVPRSKDWDHAVGEFPSCSTVRRHFGDWNRGLERAGLHPTATQARYRWEDGEILQVLQRWSAQHGRAPRRSEWPPATRDRPGETTICNHFGSWQAALAAAGLEPSFSEPPKDRATRRS